MKPATGDSRLPLRGSSFLRWWTRLCLVTGSFALLWSLYFWADAHLYQAVQRRRFDAVAASEDITAEPLARLDAFKIPRLAIGSVLGRMEIPRIGISVMVLEGDDARVLRRGAGHLQGTAVPGEPGNVAIAGHRDTFFRALRNIRDDDTIELATLRGSYEYRVESVEVVEPDDAAVLAPSRQPTLTLITCYPFYYVGPSPGRFIVRARQMSSDWPAR